MALPALQYATMRSATEAARSYQSDLVLDCSCHLVQI